MTETSALEFWILLICAAAYVHFLQLSIRDALHNKPANEDKAEPETPGYGLYAIESVGLLSTESGSGPDGGAPEESGWRFDAPTFLNGAWAAYEKIVEAYAEGDIAALKRLLGADAFGVFEAAIAERRRKGEEVELAFVRIQPPEILETDTDTETAQVTVRFDSELVTTTRAANGRIVSGDPHKVVSVRDIWTFTRDKSSPDPTWKLIATNAE
ncbi:MAG: Tim44/TimA family putative adaptor protein [Variibacter sp.]